MLSLARNFLMVPLGLNQLCLPFCRTSISLFVSCFHSRDMKTVRILLNRKRGRINNKDKNVKQVVSVEQFGGGLLKHAVTS